MKELKGRQERWEGGTVVEMQGVRMWDCQLFEIKITNIKTNILCKVSNEDFSIQFLLYSK